MNLKAKKWVCLLIAGAFSLSACSTGGASSSGASLPESEVSSQVSSGEASSQQAADPNLKAETLPDVLKLPESTADYAAKLQAIYDGTDEYANQPTAEMITSMGTVKVRLFPTQAPKTVENFITHAKNGYYDGVTFHRVMEDFMAQGGDPNGTGTGGESIWGGNFEDEFSDDLCNLRGALSMANAGANTNGSQFFIVQNSQPLTAEQREQMTIVMAQNRMQYALAIAQGYMQQAVEAGKSEADLDALADQYNAQLEQFSSQENVEAFSKKMEPVLDLYAKVGGTPFLDYKHTVFGYVYEGMDVVDAMVKVEKEPDPSGGTPSKPKTPIVIEKIIIHE